MQTQVATTRFVRGKLPHWEVERGRYFVTVRCYDSLPKDAVTRLDEIHQSIRDIEPKSPAFAQLQRQYFRTLEKYLDAGHGEPWLASREVAAVVMEEFDAAKEIEVGIPHFTVMPNHWHALLVPAENCELSLSQILRRLKGRMARRINAQLKREGTLWQREWFDHWMR